MVTNKIKLLTLSVVLVFGVVACEKPASTESDTRKIETSSEQASDKMDKAADKLGDETEKSSAILQDASTTAKVKTSILAESGLKGFEIGVKTVDSVVTLTGTVDTQATSDKAKKIAADVSGVKRVENLIVVKP